MYSVQQTASVQRRAVLKRTGVSAAGNKAPCGRRHASIRGKTPDTTLRDRIVLENLPLEASDGRRDKFVGPDFRKRERAFGFAA